MTRRTDSVRLIGRRRERSAARRAVEAGLNGVRAVTAIVGVAGIGKSTLAADTAASAREAGARVVYGMADEFDRSAFGLWREPWARMGGTGGLVDAGLRPEDQRWDVLARLSEALQRAAPAVLVLEDLHWTDALSSWVLARLAAVEPLLSLIRPSEVLRLRGLDEAEVEELAHTLSPELNVDAASLLARTGGNPLFVRELVRSPSDEVRGLVGSALEVSFAPLSRECPRVLQDLSIGGAETPMAILGDVSGETSGGLVARLNEAVDHDVLVSLPVRGIAFRYALLAKAAAAPLTDDDRRSVHRSLAEQWASSTLPGAAARTARHLVAAVQRSRTRTAWHSSHACSPLECAAEALRGRGGLGSRRRAAPSRPVLDALHLGAAQRLGTAMTFISFDTRQAQIARTLGFRVGGR